MSYRFMRVLVFFDLPTKTLIDKKNYRDFRRFLIKNGFMMMQESVYAKISKNMPSAIAIGNKIKENIPKKGLVQMLIITEKQYSRMEILIGEENNEYITDDRRLIILWNWYQISLKMHLN